MNQISVLPLGQVGFRLAFDETVIYIDPYLSDYVAEIEGPKFKRLFPISLTPESICDADWVLLSHAHADHCDPKTIGPLAEASPNCCFTCPTDVKDTLLSLNIEENRIFIAPEEKWFALSHTLRLTTVPSAHPDVVRGVDGRALCVGFVLEYKGRRFYHSGDTSVTQELIEKLKNLCPIDVAFLPVNERNYFRERRGIIGNMTIREAFMVAEDIGVRVVVPTHWDMFAQNCVFREEIELLYRKIKPSFELSIYPNTL